MATYLMLGDYTQKSLKGMSAERTEKANALIEKLGGKFISGYALLGNKDLVLIVDFPSNEDAMKTSVALSKMLGVGFSTYPAVNFETFDKLTKDI